MYEIYTLPQGKIIFTFISTHLNTGALYLNPHQALPKHIRPITEQLLQIIGTSQITLFTGNNMSNEVTLQENDPFTIPASQFHIHTNPTDNISVTLWRFDGDITPVIEDIRKNYQPLLK